MIASETAIAMASARVETFSFLFAFSKCSCAVDGEIPSLWATSRSVAPERGQRRLEDYFGVRVAKPPLS